MRDKHLVTPASPTLLLSLIGLGGNHSRPEDPLHLVLGVEVFVLYDQDLLGGSAVHHGGVITDSVGLTEPGPGCRNK